MLNKRSTDVIGKPKAVEVLRTDNSTDVNGKAKGVEQRLIVVEDSTDG